MKLNKKNIEELKIRLKSRDIDYIVNNCEGGKTNINNKQKQQYKQS